MHVWVKPSTCQHHLPQPLPGRTTITHGCSCMQEQIDTHHSFLLWTIPDSTWGFSKLWFRLSFKDYLSDARITYQRIWHSFPLFTSHSSWNSWQSLCDLSHSGKYAGLFWELCISNQKQLGSCAKWLVWKKIVKSEGWPRNSCDGKGWWIKKFNNNNSGEFCADPWWSQDEVTQMNFCY